MAIAEWRKFENDVQELFLSRMERERMVYHRFYDTASAGNFLPAQPGDHLVVYQGMPILIETKYSGKHATLRSCFSSNVDDGQMGSHRIWTRAGAITLLAFRGTEGHELWDGAYLVECRMTGTRLDLSRRLKHGTGLQELFSKVVIPGNGVRKLYVF
jgi:hypothetical protein